MEQLSKIGFGAAHRKYRDMDMFIELCRYQDTELTPEKIMELLAEVERLTAENTGLRANSMIQEHIISSGSDPIRDDKIIKLIMESTTLKQAYDTNAEVHQKLTEDYVALKSERDVAVRALEMACDKIRDETGDCPFSAGISEKQCEACNDDSCEGGIELWVDYYIQQAKEDLKK